MGFDFKKKSIQTKISSPRAKPSGVSKFAHVSAPHQASLKTKIYTKGVLRTDPTEFGNSGFGDTGLDETPSVKGMGSK